MGRVAGKKHAAVAQPVQAFAAVGVRADPDDLAFIVAEFAAELGIQPGAHHVFPADFLRVGIGRHLVIDAPDAVGHQVLPHGPALVKGRFNPGVAFDGGRRFKTHIGNAPAVVAFFGRDRGLAPAAKRAVRAGAVDHVFGLQCVAAGRRGDGQRGVVGVLFNRRDAVLPAQIHGAVLRVRPAKLLDQETLDIKLLDIDKGRLQAQRMRLLQAQVKRVHLVAAGKGDAAAHDDDGVAFDFAAGDFRRFYKRVFGQLVARALGKFISVGKNCFGIVCLCLQHAGFSPARFYK